MHLTLSGKTIETDNKAFVMGIVNCTPDSFFSKSRGGIEIAKKMISEGADLLDIGGESTRPGSEYVSEEEELSRILPVIKEIRKISSIPISVDTRKKAVMEEAWKNGADVLNDISALEDDPSLADFCAEKKLSVILMHKRGTPLTMQNNTGYKNAFDEVNAYLRARADFAIKKGISRENILLDPGIGFGKGDEANRMLIARCGSLCEGDFPVVMALSRKSCIGKITGRDVDERLSGTLAANLLSVISGATVLRVHDVKETVDSLRVYSALSSYTNFTCREEVL